LDLDSRSCGCARLGGEVGPPLGVVAEEVAVLVVLVRRHRHAVRAAVRRAVDDEVPGAIEEETGPAAVRRVPPGLMDALPVNALGALGIIVVVRDVGPRQVVCDDVADAAHAVFLLGPLGAPLEQSTAERAHAHVGGHSAYRSLVVNAENQARVID